MWIHNFILAFWEPKWISHTKSYREGHISQLDRILILRLGGRWFNNDFFAKKSAVILLNNKHYMQPYNEILYRAILLVD